METSDSVLGDFFRAAIDIPEIPFGEMLWESAQRFPEKTALVFQGQHVSFRELDGLANSFANVPPLPIRSLPRGHHHAGRTARAADATRVGRTTT